MNQRGCILLSLALVGVLALTLVAQEPAENDRLIRIAGQAGTGVQWIADPYHPADHGRSRSGRQQPARQSIDRGILLDAALARAQASRRLVLLYAFRFDGSHMYRAPVLDEYMNLAVFSDPELVALINRLTEQEQRAGVIPRVLTELDTYVKEHFRTEEALMRAHNFTDLEEHELQHRAFEEWLHAVRDVYNFTSSTDVFADTVNSFLRNWLINHILKADMAYKPFLTKRS